MRSFTWIPILVVAVVGIPSPASAFGLEGLGVKAGGAFLTTNFAFEGTDVLDDDARLGAVVGVTSDWELQRRSAFRIVVEALYVRKGYEGVRSLPDDVDPIDIDAGASYLSVPILGRVHFVDDDDLSIYAVFGPSLEFLLSRDDDVILDAANDLSLAGNVGIGAEWTIADPVRLQVEARFNTDLTEVIDGEIGGTDITEARYQMIQFTAGLRY